LRFRLGPAVPADAGNQRAALTGWRKPTSAANAGTRGCANSSRSLQSRRGGRDSMSSPTRPKSS
jgi:hypothetical protein